MKGRECINVSLRERCRRRRLSRGSSDGGQVGNLGGLRPRLMKGAIRTSVKAPFLTPCPSTWSLPCRVEDLLTYLHLTETLHTVWQTPLVPSTTEDSMVPNNTSSSSRSVSNPFPMAAHSATAALEKQQSQRSVHPSLTTQTTPSQALRAPAVFRIPMAPFPSPASTLPPPPIKQLGSLSLRDGNDAPISDPFAGVGRTIKPMAVPLTTGDQTGRGVIGMGFGQGFVGSGLLEGGAPLVKRGSSSKVVSGSSKAAV